MSILTDKLLQDKSPKENSSFGLPFFLAILVSMLALFIGDTLFGKNSLEVFSGLQKDQKLLEKKIYIMKTKNAALQKKYFELKNIMPEE